VGHPGAREPPGARSHKHLPVRSPSCATHPAPATAPAQESLGTLIANAGPGQAIARIDRMPNIGMRGQVLLHVDGSVVPPGEADITPTVYTVADGLKLPGRVMRLAGGTASLEGVTSIFSEAKARFNDPAFAERKKREREERDDQSSKRK